MGFEFQDKAVVESYGKWSSDTFVSACDGLDRLLNELNVQYRNHTQSEGNPHELNYGPAHVTLYKSGRVLIMNAKDSINMRRVRQGVNFLGRIEANVSTSEGKLRVAIEDNGLGIDPEVEPYLFTCLSEMPIPQHLLKRNMDTKAGGITGWFGVDLIQVREKVEGLGGKVFYENKGQNLGAIFGYEIPISSLHVPQALEV